MIKNMLMNQDDETSPIENIRWPDEIYLFSTSIYKN